MTKSDNKDLSKLSPAENIPRRWFLKNLVKIFMTLGLALSYGNFLSIMGRYLFPDKGRKKEWLFVSELSRLKPGDSIPYQAPSGEKIAIARHSASGKVSDFIALSSTCPHLGCQVHWEGNNNRFFCPCHNGAFDASGTAVAGPPAEAKQKLSTYPLKIENDLLFIEAPLEKIDKPSELNSPNMPGASMPPRFPEGNS